MTDTFLTLRDLKARGWTQAMIHALLGLPDQERSTNRLGHQRATPVKLYLETRVMQLETTEAFVHAQARASVHQAIMVRAYQNRHAWEAQLVARYEALSLPTVQRYPVEADHTLALQPHLWQLHLQEFYLWQRAQEHLLMELSPVRRRAAEHGMLQRYQAAVHQAYGELEQIKKHAAPARP